jgi:hypothetical protein
MLALLLLLLLLLLPLPLVAVLLLGLAAHLMLSPLLMLWESAVAVTVAAECATRFAGRLASQHAAVCVLQLLEGDGAASLRARFAWRSQISLSYLALHTTLPSALRYPSSGKFVAVPVPLLLTATRSQTFAASCSWLKVPR